MKGKKSRRLKSVLWGVFWILAGAALCVGSFLIPAIKTEPYLKWIVLCLGAWVMVAAAVGIALVSSHNSSSGNDTLAQKGAAVGAEGKKQTVEQKLAQVDMMDEMQFALYVSRLFQNKGYSVRLTPAYDNRGVSFVAQVGGESTAVICLLSSQVIGDVEVKSVCSDWSSYPCKSATLVANANFSKSARRFAAKNGIYLVGRKELIDLYM